MKNILFSFEIKENKHLLGFKIFVVFILVLLLGVFQTPKVYAQSKKVTIVSEKITIKQVMIEIEKQTGYMFVYNPKDVDVNQSMKINVRNSTVANVLKDILKPIDIVYEMNNNNILLKVKQKTPVQETKQTSLGADCHIVGSILDKDGTPIVGASIIIKGSNGQGTITDVDGLFKLDTKEGATLEISYIGYVKQELKVGKSKKLRVVLQEDNKILDEVVVVGYGNQRRLNIAGSVASIKSEDLAKSPVASVSNALSGKLPGLITLQSTGLPGSDEASLQIRGFDAPLVLIDGAEGDINNLDANEIESVSILKDASAAIYGSRAGNGVILITTKRGIKGKPTLTLNTSFTWQGITNMPKMVSSGQYAELRRESHIQSGQSEDTAPYTLEEIQKFYDGTDPQYPNTDWYGLLIRDWSPQQQHNISIRGGSDNIKFYGFLGYMKQETFFKRSGSNYKRYNIRGSIDATITRDLSASMDFSLVVGNRDYTLRNPNDNIWGDFWNTYPIYPASLPDPTKIPYADGAGTGGAHITTDRNLSGYSDTRTQETRFIGELVYKFRWLEGLQAKTRLEYTQTNISTKNFAKPVPFYKYDYASDTYTLAGSFNKTATLEYNLPNARKMMYQTSLSYKNCFNKIHDINALVLFEAIDDYSNTVTAARTNFLTSAIDEMLAGSTEGITNSGWSSEMGRMSWVGRLNYSLMDRYIMEATFRADASAKFPKESRWGYFPSVLLAWRINEEPFMKSIKDLDALKLRLSYGESGNDNVSNFAYLTGYDITSRATGGSYVFGNNRYLGILPKGLANSNLTWEKMKFYNVGFDFSLWKSLLYGTFDAFYRKREGIPGTRLKTLPSTFGATLPLENLNSINTRGFELSLATSGNYYGIHWNISGNISWARSKWNYYEEPGYEDADQRRLNKLTGEWTDRTFGYVAAGLFTSQEEIDNLPYDQDLRGNITLRPGDIKYLDVNDDKVIDWRDQVEIGQGTVPTWFYGFNPSVTYKNFDFNILFQGAFGFDVIAHLDDKTEDFFSNRWTESNNNPNALIPRTGGAGSNSWMSSFWLVPGDYLRIKSLNFGYTFKNNSLKSAGVESIRAYFSGSNLYTWSKLKKYGLDPEVPSGKGSWYYPQHRDLSIGLSVIF